MSIAIQVANSSTITVEYLSRRCLDHGFVEASGTVYCLGSYLGHSAHDYLALESSLPSALARGSEWEIYFSE